MNGRESDEQMMREALRLAEAAALAGEVPVGAVVVQDGVIIGRGRNMRETASNALAHAELVAIDEACKALSDWRLARCAIYVTLEPCPMCAGAILNARIDRVVYGASDPRAGALGSLIDLSKIPYAQAPRITAGVLAAPCSDLLRSFFEELRER